MSISCSYEEIAFRVSFTEHRAFGRWVGISPSELRAPRQLEGICRLGRFVHIGVREVDGR